MVAPKKAALKKSTETATADCAPRVNDTGPLTYTGPFQLRMLDRKGLATVLSTLANVADAKSTMPILGHVLMRVDSDGTTLAATDLNVYATYRAPAWIGGRGGCTVAAKQVADVVRKMPRNDVEIRRAEHGIVVASGKVQSAITGLHDRDFPRVPIAADDATWSPVLVSSLMAVLRPTIGAVCQDETRFHLNGVYLESANGYLIGVATDGHRLHKAQAPCSWRLEKGAIVPTRALKLLIKTLTPGMCEIALDPKSPYMHVRQGGWTFAIKLIDAQFPPYEQVIPKEHKVYMTVQRDAFVESLERARIYASDTRGVHLKIEGRDLVVRADNPDTGTMIERVPSEHDTGGTFEIGANVKYLIESLKMIDDDRVTFACCAELDPLLVRSSEDMGTRSLAESALVCVVMPMRI